MACRDIKPENVFLHSAGILLGDWGLGIDNVQERPVSRVGTLDYMAPEVLSAPSIPPGVNFRVPAGSDEPGSYDPSVRTTPLGNPRLAPSSDRRRCTRHGLTRHVRAVADLWRMWHTASEHELDPFRHTA